MLDKMSICKHVQWDAKKYQWLVDLGTNIDDDFAAQSYQSPCVYSSLLHIYLNV